MLEQSGRPLSNKLVRVHCHAVVVLSPSFGDGENKGAYSTVRSRPERRSWKCSKDQCLFLLFLVASDFNPSKKQLKSVPVFCTSYLCFALAVRPQSGMIAPLGIHISHLPILSGLGRVSIYLF